jgi:hypothetical protein
MELTSTLAQQGGRELFLLGDDFLPWMVLALGAALVAGNLLAIVRPPRPQDATEQERARETGRAGPPLARTTAMIVLGLLAGGWGLASLVTN